jgi:hypothetical protein
MNKRGCFIFLNYRLCVQSKIMCSIKDYVFNQRLCVQSKIMCSIKDYIRTYVSKSNKWYSLFFKQVQSRIWPCWKVVCNCGVAIRENDDVVTIDMCNGAWRRTVPRVIQKSKQPLGNRIKITRYGSGQSTRFKVRVHPKHQ